MKNNLPQRKPIRLKEYDYRAQGCYFITICIKNRLPLLGSIKGLKLEISKEGIIVDKYISSFSEIYNNVELDEYVIMPNHIHMILTINKKGDTSVSKVIQQFKGMATKEIGYSIWQKLFYEHIIRNEKEYYVIKQYIQNNIINWKNDTYFA